MDTLDTYRQCIEKVLRDYAQLPYAYGEVREKWSATAAVTITS